MYLGLTLNLNIINDIRIFSEYIGDVFVGIANCSQVYCEYFF